MKVTQDSGIYLDAYFTPSTELTLPDGAWEVVRLEHKLAGAFVRLKKVRQ